VRLIQVDVILGVRPTEYMVSMTGSLHPSELGLVPRIYLSQSLLDLLAQKMELYDS
jgi:hypothetical protein